MLLLCDHSLEIPPFLQRAKDNTLKYPSMPVANVDIVTGTVTPMPRWPVCEADEIAKKELLMQEATRQRLKAIVGYQEKKAEKALDKERHKAHREAQKKVFHKHFRWSYEI